MRLESYAFNFVKEVSVFGISAEGEFNHWQDMLDTLIMEIRRIQKFGFSIEEFMLSQKHFLALYKQLVKLEETKPSTKIISQLNNVISNNQLPLSASQSLKIG